MIPIRDTIPAKSTAVGTWSLILARSVVFIFELMMPEPHYKKRDNEDKDSGPLTPAR